MHDIDRFLSDSLGSAARVFTDPFLNFSQRDLPRVMEIALRVAEYIYHTLGIYRGALERVISYFITDIELRGDIDEKTRREYMEFLKDRIKIFHVLRRIGSDIMCYGNCFVSVLQRKHKILNCPACIEQGKYLNVRLSTVLENKDKFAFQWQSGRFVLKCPECGFHGVWHDLKNPPKQSAWGVDDIFIQLWSPHDIKIVWEPVSQTSQYLYKVPNQVVEKIKKGEEIFLLNTPWPIIEAALTTGYLLFEPDEVLHLKDDVPSGFETGGWGWPRSIVHFRHIWQLLLLYKFNEAIAIDYALPLRVVSPPQANPGAEGADPLSTTDALQFISFVNGIVEERRRDPTSWFVSPWPLQYQVMGGEGKALAPVDQINVIFDHLMSAMGVPMELYKGSLNAQGMPPAIRLFESIWTGFVQQLNTALNWIVRKISLIKDWEQVDAKLLRPTVADDFRRQAILMNLMGAKAISQHTALQTLGIDYEEEVHRMMEEEKFQAQMQKQLQDELNEMNLGYLMATGQIQLPGQAPPQGAQAGGAAPAAGPAPAGAPAGGSQTAQQAVQSGDIGQMLQAASGVNSPQDLLSIADAIAQQLLGMPYSLRRSQLLQIKQVNELLHSLVIARLEDYRQQAASMGKVQILQQTFGPSAG